MKFYGPHQLQFPNSVKISKLREGSPLARGHLLLLPLPWHLFQKMLSSIPEFSGFRALFQSSEPMELTEAETEYAVSVVKHMSLSALMPQMLRIFQGFVQSLLQACRIIHLEKFLLLLKSQIVYLLLGNFKICSSSQLKRLFSFAGVSHLLAKSGWVLALGLQTLIDCIGKRI